MSPDGGEDGGELDRGIERLFEEAGKPLDGEVFLAGIERRLHRLRRGLLMRRIILRIALLGSLAAATPLIASETLRLSGYVSEAIPGLGAALLAPSGWAASVLLAFWAMRRWRFAGR